MATFTLQDIRNKVRRITGNVSTQQLTDADLDDAINNAYALDMPADIKSDLFREVVQVYTVPNVDRYALAGTLANNLGPNTYESIREPIYVEGMRAGFYKDRGQFYNAWPLVTTLNTSLTGDGAAVAFPLTVGSPLLQQTITIGTIIGGVYQTYEDDGDLNRTGTGQIVPTGGGASIGTIVYATGVFALTFPTAPDNGAAINFWYYVYSAGRPSCVMWWKNELIVRPVPDRVYKIEMEAYKFPTQMTDVASTPILNQWWQYLAYLSSIKIMVDRQDMEGVANIAPILDRQEGLVRNRIANEQVGQRNTTLYEGNNNINAQNFFYGGW